MRIGALVALSFVLLTCIACSNKDPDALRVQASSILTAARQKNPYDPNVRLSQISLDEGSKSYLEGDYAHAARSFSDSLILSQSVLDAPSVMVAEGLPLEVFREKKLVESPKRKEAKLDPKSKVSRALEEKHISEALPEVKVEPASEPEKPKAKPASKPKPAPKPVPKPLPKPAVKIEPPAPPPLAPEPKREEKMAPPPPKNELPKPAPKNVDEQEQAALEKPIVAGETVTAISGERAQVVTNFPKPRRVDEEGNDEVLVSIAPPLPRQVRDAKPVKLREKIPGVIVFGYNEPVFQSVSRPTLDKLAKSLKENPSASVVFEAQLSEGEESNLVNVRFEAIKTYLLQNRHIREEQIELDEKRMVGDWPEFTMYQLN